MGTEAWLAGITIFDERKIGSPKWGDLDEDDDEGIQSSKVIVDGQVEGNINEKGDYAKEIRTGISPLEPSTEFNPNDPHLYNQVPLRREYSGVLPSDAGKQPTSPFADGREYSYINEKGRQKSPIKTQVQESSSVQVPLVNRGEGTEEDKAKWISFLNGPRTSKPNTPSRDGPSNSPTYDPGSHWIWWIW